MQEWSYTARGHNKVNHRSEVQLKESSFQSIYLFPAAGLRLRRSLRHRHTVACLRGMLGAPPPDGSTVASCG